MDARVAELVADFLRQARPIVGAQASAVVYGSAARGDWSPAHSDINLLVVADQLGGPELRALGPALAGLPAEWRNAPLVFTRAEWARAVDVFPIELTDMQLAHVAVLGADPLAGLHPDPSQLRAALERELRTKLLRLRQGYALRAGDPGGLGELASRTLRNVMVLGRVTLVLLDRPVPAEAIAVLRAFAEATGAPSMPLVELASHWREEGWLCPAHLFEQYLECIAVSAAFIDHHLPGAP